MSFINHKHTVQEFTQDLYRSQTNGTWIQWMKYVSFKIPAVSKQPQTPEKLKNIWTQPPKNLTQELQTKLKEKEKKIWEQNNTGIGENALLAVSIWYSSPCFVFFQTHKILYFLFPSQYSICRYIGLNWAVTRNVPRFLTFYIKSIISSETIKLWFHLLK